MPAAALFVRVLAVTIVVTASSVVGRSAPTASADPLPTTGVELLDGARLFDSRDPATPLTPGEPFAWGGQLGDIVNVTLAAATESSQLYIGRCDHPEWLTRAAVQADAGQQVSNLVPVRSSDSCLTLFGDATVTVDRVARQGQPAGLDYHGDVASILLNPSVHADGQIVGVGLLGGGPSDVEAIAVRVTATAGPEGSTTVSATRCDGSSVPGQSITARRQRRAQNLFLAPLDDSGRFCFGWTGTQPVGLVVERVGTFSTNSNGGTDGLPFESFVEYFSPRFNAVEPQRLLDTRVDGPAITGGLERRLPIATVPSDATAISINLTATDTSGPGFVSVHACSDHGETSGVNFTRAGETVANALIVTLGSTRHVCVAASATTDVVVDLNGYFAPSGGAGLITSEPSRVADTRAGAPVAAGTSYRLDLSGQPAEYSAALLNVTVTQPSGPGFAVAYACDQPLPLASNVNFLAGETRANLATVTLSVDETVCIHVSAQAHLVLDLIGGYGAGTDVGFHGPSARIHDTRTDPGEAPVGAGETLELVRGDQHDDALRAVAWNVTVTDPSSPGFVTAFPCAHGVPDTSSVNFSSPGSVVANLAIVAVDDAHQACVRSSASTHVVVDEMGRFVSAWHRVEDGEFPLVA